MRRFHCRQARWVAWLVGGPHGESLGSEIERQFNARRRLRGKLRRRIALLSLWRELSPAVFLFAGRRIFTRRPRNSFADRIDPTVYAIRAAWRSLWRRPGFTVLAVGTLALGIGANTAIFSIVNGVLLRPLPYHEAEELLTVWVAPGQPGGSRGSMSYPDIADVREQAPSIESLVGLSSSSLTLTGMGEPAILTAVRVSDGLLSTFKLAPIIGRDIRNDEFGPDSPAVVVISHSLWQQRFGGRDDVLGETLTLDGFPFEVVGVAPQGFDYPFEADLWYPRRINPESCGRGCHTWLTIGRLTPGARIAAAQAEADGIAANLSQAYPKSNLDKRFAVISLREQIVGDVRLGLWVLLGAVGAVLMIACANVANLMLARAAARRGEIAVRAALGASPRQLAATLLIESGILASLGAVAGLLLARAGIGALQRLSAGSVPRVDLVSIDASVLAFTGAVSAIVALLFGFSPAMHLVRTPVTLGLSASGRGSDLAAGGRRLRAALTAVEVGLSVVLLVGAGLLLRTFVQLYAVDPGFETRQVLRFTLSLPAARYGELDQMRIAFRSIENDLAALPGVESVGSIYGAPMHNSGTAGDLIIEGEEPAPPGREKGAAIRSISPGYMETMRIPLVAGRALGPADDTSELNVAVVNEALVRDNFPDGNAIGRRVRVTASLGFDSPFWTIVGVVGDVRSSRLTREPRPELYVPHGRFGAGYMVVNLRAVAAGPDLVEAVRERVQAFDPDLPLQRIETIDQVVERAVAPTRFFLVGVAVFATVATALAAVGLYGVMAYLVSHRTREIGIRVALGADRGEILRMVVRDGLRPTAVGLAAGILLSLVGGRLIEGLLFGVDAGDPAVLVSVPLALSLVALAAIAVPAARACRVDPLRSLRAD